MADKIMINLTYPPNCGIISIGGLNRNESHRRAKGRIQRISTKS